MMTNDKHEQKKASINENARQHCKKNYKLLNYNHDDIKDISPWFW